MALPLKVTVPVPYVKVPLLVKLPPKLNEPVLNEMVLLLVALPVMFNVLVVILRVTTLTVKLTAFIDELVGVLVIEDEPPEIVRLPNVIPDGIV